MSPWYFVTVPVGILICMFIAILIVGVYRTGVGKEAIERMINDRISGEFYKTDVREVWRRFEKGQEMEVYLRVNPENIDKYKDNA